MRIYNLFPLLAGKFHEWTPHLARAARMNFNWVFVNPIQYPGYSGSLYSIKDYFGFNPLLVNGAGEGAAAEFKRTAAEAKKLGLRLMVDLVANHCAFDSELVAQHPNWFDCEGGKPIHPSCIENHKKVVWEDLAQFNHNSADKEGLFQFMLRVVGHLVDLGFTGFRCDAAYQLPGSFWHRLISETRRKHAHIVFMAETLGCGPDQTVRTANTGFDAIFNSSCWWDFSSPWLMEQFNLTRGETDSVSFPESHDTPRLAAGLNGNVDGLKQRYLFNAFFSAGVMMPIGFEFGFRKRLHVVSTRPGDWEQTSIDLTGFIQRVNAAKAGNPVFLEDAPTNILHADNPNILFMWKGSARTPQEALLILNKDIYNYQPFHTNLYRHIRSAGPLTDVSPEYPLDFLPTPFEYNLRPGQGIVLVTDKPAG